MATARATATTTTTLVRARAPRPTRPPRRAPSREGTFAAQSAKVQPGGVASYRMSKAAQNMATRVFAAELRARGYVIIALSPGWVATDMGSSGGRTAPLTPRKSIEGMLDVLERLEPEHTGGFFNYDSTVLPW